MKIGIIGTGYVGLPTGVGLAELGNDVICVDLNTQKINDLNNGKLTLYEQGLQEYFENNVKQKRLHFTTSVQEGVQNADIVILAVGTPPDPETKQADLQYIFAAAQETAPYLTHYTVIAVKSTVPVGTGDQIEALIKKTNPKADFDVVSLPEFLREGFALHDFFNPDRIVVGTQSSKAIETIKQLYQPFEGKTKFLFVNRRSSETIKYASNAFLAIKIHYINEMADFCEKTGADISEVAQGLGADTRIGNKFLKAGPGFGGSCFPKDTLAMSYMAKQAGVEMRLINETISGNLQRQQNIAQKILNMVTDIPNPKIAVLGLSFKDGTDDCRESPAIRIIEEMLKFAVQISAYDPKGIENAKQILGNKIKFNDSIEQVLENADIVAILTEWADFKTLDFEKAALNMRNKRIFDARNLLDAQNAEKHGFVYQGIGK